MPLPEVPGIGSSLAATLGVLATGACVLPGAIGMANLFTAPRLRQPPRERSATPDGGAGDVRCSLLIPMRDEAARMSRLLPCLSALRASNPRLEILLLDDHSGDGGGSLARAAGFAVLTGRPLPQGWVGKNWACQQLADAARGRILVFMDADVEPSANSIHFTQEWIEGGSIDTLTVLPRQTAGSAWVDAVVPWVMQLSIIGLLPLALVPRLSHPSLCVANGQWLAFRREVYFSIGGHAAVRASVLEDMELGRRAKASGARSIALLGPREVSVGMYRGWRELRGGFGKNLYPLVGGTPGAASGAALVLVAWTLGPLIAFFATGPRSAILAAVGLLVHRVATALAFRGSLRSIVMHPFGGLLTGAILAISMRGHLRGEVFWKGRGIVRAGP